VTLPRPDLPIVLLSHRGPVSYGRDESGHTASRGAGRLVTVELIGRNREMAQLRQGLTSRIWIEQAKGVLAASQEVPPDERLQHRVPAWSSSCKLADLVREVLVREAQRERVAALAMDDARVRVAEARAQAAEQALQAGPNRTGPTYRSIGPSPRRPGPTGAGRRPGRLAGGRRW
jgi:hypothetical protein